MESWSSKTYGLSTSSISIAIILSYTAIYYYLAIYKRSSQDNPTSSRKDPTQEDPSNPTSLTTLQRHVLFWDRDGDDIIYPHDVYAGFRAIGFSIPFSLTALLIPVVFSYPTRLGHSYIPDPLLRIYINSIHKAKHGSDTGVYDLAGDVQPRNFENLFAVSDDATAKESGSGSRSGSGLSARDLWRMVKRNRVAADPAGWSFAVMEWATTWLLLQKGGRVQKEDLRQCYEGSLFWRLAQERRDGVPSELGYGWSDFGMDILERVHELRYRTFGSYHR